MSPVLPDVVAHHVIESIAITGGHLSGARLELADGLNCVIGGRGAGKSTLLVCICFALGVEFAPAYAAAHDALLRATLGGGEVKVRIRTQHGMRYEASRSVGEPPRVVGENGEPVAAKLDGDLFKVELYGQNQIEGIAASSSAQLALLDKFEPEARRIERELFAIEQSLAQNAAELSRFDREIDEDEDRTRDLPSVTETLKGLVLAGGSPLDEASRAFDGKAERTRERAALERAIEALVLLRDGLAERARDVDRHLSPNVFAPFERGPNGEVMTSVARELGAVGRVIAESNARLAERLDAAASVLAAGDQALTALHAKQEAAYRTLIARHDDDRQRSLERERLERLCIELSAVEERLVDRRRERAARAGERKGLLADLLRLRAERFAARQRVASELSLALAGEVRVSVRHDADCLAYEALLADTLRGENIRPASFVREIARNIRPHELAALVLANDPEPIVALDDSKTGKMERARRILDALRASGRLYAIEILGLDDVPLIELRTGAGYKPSAELSTGQRCTSILPILLLRQATPLLVNQPEDNLDNAFIYEVLVKSVAVAKRARQLVFVTHNPNIPVLGDAERVFVLEANGDHGVVAKVGSVEEVRDPIERILEGGREAFLLRSRRYGHEGA